MLTVETIGRIRREHFLKRKTIRQIARDLRVSRNTVRKVLRSGGTAFVYEREIQPPPKLGRSPLRDHRDRQRQLALQKPRLIAANRSLATALWGRARSRFAWPIASTRITSLGGSKLDADQGSILDAD